MLDTAAVALVVWNQWGPQVRENATDVFAPGDQGLARARFAVLAGAHDVGKASREFNGQAWSRSRKLFAAHRKCLQAAGLPMDMPAQRPPLASLEGLWLRHEAVTGLILHDQTGLPSWARRVITGHHGRYQPAGPQRLVSKDLDDLRERASDPAWAKVQQSVLDDLVAAVTAVTGREATLVGWPQVIEPRLVPFLVALTGFVCVCDWVASDEVFVKDAPRTLLEDGDLSGYVSQRSTGAQEALDGVLLGSGTPSGSFAQLFSGLEARGDTQKWAAGRRHGPGLTIVMAPMGEGKTEVALQMHTADGSVAPDATARDGLFFGLPTMATADAVFGRVQQFWAGTSGVGRLAHSQAVLSDFYAPSTLRPSGVCDHGHGSADREDNGGLRPADWFTGRHRGLLAPVTVGTCDQVLAAALDHKYLQVRLAALAGKHVVLDEVHTYDPYQHELLMRLLGWLGAFRCRVTLLSATLPRARVAELAAAWSAGWHANAAPDVREEALAGLPALLPYPSVVTVQDTLVCEPLQAWRRYNLDVRTHSFPAGRDELLDATTALVGQVRQAQPQARIGLLVNTVDRAIGLFERLAPSEGGRSVLLHSRMTAGQRRSRTAALDGLVGQKAPAGRVLVVATQVAEASLDLDLDVLITDLAPMASLLQRAGRLWRHSVNTGAGWTHPAHLGYRMGDPVVHVLVPMNSEGQVAAGFAALPYTTAELRRAWEHPDCLAAGARARFRIPQDMQAAVDAAHLSLQDLAGQADLEPGDTQHLLRHLGAELAKSAAARGTGHRVDVIARRWRADRGPDPWGADERDWSALTAPTLWDDSDGVVTRLQERQQARILLWDRTGQTPWAWHGDPVTLLHRAVSRKTLLAALDASVPVSGQLAARLRAASAAHVPQRWAQDAPPLLRGLTPLPVSALSGIAALDYALGLTRQETTS